MCVLGCALDFSLHTCLVSSWLALPCSLCLPQSISSFPFLLFHLHLISLVSTVSVFSSVFSSVSVQSQFRSFVLSYSVLLGLHTLLLDLGVQHLGPSTVTLTALSGYWAIYTRWIYYTVINIVQHHAVHCSAVECGFICFSWVNPLCKVSRENTLASFTTYDR